QARLLALTPEQVVSPLAARPYDLRHAAVSLWLNACVPAPEVAERAGHSVEVLVRVYAKCLDEGQDMINTRIEAALLLRAMTARPGGVIPRISHARPLTAALRGIWLPKRVGSASTHWRGELGFWLVAGVGFEPT